MLSLIWKLYLLVLTKLANVLIHYCDYRLFSNLFLGGAQLLVWRLWLKVTLSNPTWEMDVQIGNFKKRNQNGALNPVTEVRSLFSCASLLMRYACHIIISGDVNSPLWFKHCLVPLKRMAACYFLELIHLFLAMKGLTTFLNAICFFFPF